MSSTRARASAYTSLRRAHGSGLIVLFTDLASTEPNISAMMGTTCMTIGIVAEVGIFSFLEQRDCIERGMTLALAGRSAPC